ncbi:MAG: thiamine phosphate synthase [Sulfuricella sp.]|nr:thiamine phosphate synthase [Sulfuricella sp.]
MPTSLNGLYAITPQSADTAALLAEVRLALEGGARLVQYRDKSADVALRFEQASELLVLCRKFGAPLIVNDDLRLADLVGADGLHIGKDDGSLREARLILGPHSIIGVSCYNDLQLARAAQDGGASYAAFGSFFPSPTKPQAIPASLDLLRQAKGELHIPLVAIGGITAANGAALVAAGADALAVISAIFDTPDIRAAAAAFSPLFNRPTLH